MGKIERDGKRRGKEKKNCAQSDEITGHDQLASIPKDRSRLKVSSSSSSQSSQVSSRQSSTAKNRAVTQDRTETETEKTPQRKTKTKNKNDENIR
jgi:hypothetical protein